MKQRAKGLFAVVFLGGILITSLVVIAIPGLEPTERGMDPLAPSGADFDRDYSANYDEADRVMYCGTGLPPLSTAYIREFAIPTECTNPLAIAVDYDGNPWFAESNTGRVATFDLETETFTEYPNPSWPEGATSMMWGMDHAPDGMVWFTDDASDSMWVFHPITGQYGRLPVPAVVSDPLPQRLVVDGSQIVVNDFYGNMLVFLDPSQPDKFLVAPSPIDGTVTAGFVPDADGYIWYTAWDGRPGGDGYLVRFDHGRYVDIAATTGQAYLPPIDFVDLIELPPTVQTPNGIAISGDGGVWLADTTSSSVFEFDPATGLFTQYVTASPTESTYGNKTGVIKSPLSRPYWMTADDAGRLVFNSQLSNNISVLDPVQQRIVEYHVPSKNPYWTDCVGEPKDGSDVGAAIVPQSGTNQDATGGAAPERCGVAQVFDFDVHGDRIWFTEWAENKIGVVDTSIPVPFDVEPSTPYVSATLGGIQSVTFDVTGPATGSGDPSAQIEPFAVSGSPHILAAILPDAGAQDDIIGYGDDGQAYAAKMSDIPVMIAVTGDAPSGIYKVLLGAQAPDVSVGRFVTVIVQ
ncbi:MAG: lyase [Thaumarchaeota archaeon]|nr:lyase [Nitrososphaerota archaeon]